MAEEAYIGLAGDVVRKIKPNTEADPVAILIQFLIAFGSAVGRHAYCQVEAVRHYPNLFATLVGATSKGRKGTSLSWVREIMKIADPEWEANKIKSGLSSGEGFIYEVRDKHMRWNVQHQIEELVDPGVTDKRLAVIEHEFAGALAVMERHGNTLSSLIRQAWDGGKLATLTKTSPLQATNAHVSILAHITEQELKARLTRTDTANGFANRFLFLLVKRSQLLPFGGKLTLADIEGLGRETSAHLIGQLNDRCITMTEAATNMWAKVYPKLSAERPGLLGAVTARAEAQALRLALIYALQANADHIDLPHLKAGLAVWEYCEASAKRIWGGATGDPVADEILAALKSAGDDGLTRTHLHALFSRHISADRLSVALTLLADRELIRGDLREREGKTVVVWVLWKKRSGEHAN